jgi:DNA helicase-2/ATP-dependent DNA helicase PcrA
MIDEYQDTNRAQYDLMRLLSSAHRNVCAVGDEDQSIYSWRGADIRNILDFERDYPGARVIRLEQNYRSTKNILAAAGAVIAHNTQRKGKTLWTEAEAGPKITVYQAADSEQEALYIADSINRLLTENPSLRVAVLYRTNSQSRQIEEALRRYRRTYVVVGGMSFYQRAEIKDMLAYLKLLVNPRDNVSLMRVINTPARGIGRTTIDQIEQYAASKQSSFWEALCALLDSGAAPGRAQAALASFRQLIEGLTQLAQTASPDQLLREVLERTGYWTMLKSQKTAENENRIENLAELINAAVEAGERAEGLTEFLDHSALLSSADTSNLDVPVVLLTVHNAKGLEFPVVFLAGMEERLFPHSRSIDNEEMIEEERRLCYVGMTRAQQRLIMTWALRRRRFGSGLMEPTVRSRFLNELPYALVERAGVAPEAGHEGVDLFVERHEVRQAVRRNLYTGKTYNSVENISEFFRERGIQPPDRADSAPAPMPLSASGSRSASGPLPMRTPPAPKPNSFAAGSTLEHPKYGRGKVLRREGDGDQAKLTVLFPAHGLKKILEKYAGLKIDE